MNAPINRWMAIFFGLYGWAMAAGFGVGLGLLISRMMGG